MPGSLLQNPISGGTEKLLWRVSYTAGDLARALADFTALGENERSAMHLAAKTFRARQFTPITRDSVHEFLFGTA